MILIPNNHFEQTTLNNFGIQPIFNNGHPSIGFIYDNSSAQKLGLAIDDIIIAVNGYSLQHTTKQDWCVVKEMLNTTTASTLPITIDRNGQQMNFVLERIELL